MLLETIKQMPIMKNVTKRRVVPGAEVVTEIESQRILKELQEKRQQKKKAKRNDSEHRNPSKAKLKSVQNKRKGNIKKPRKICKSRPNKSNEFNKDSDESGVTKISDSELDLRNLTLEDLKTSILDENLSEEEDETMELIPSKMFK